MWGIWLEKPEERRTFRRRVCKWQDNTETCLEWKMFWTGFILLRLGTISGPSEHGNEPSVE